MRVSWILMPGYLAVPTVTGSARRCNSGKSTCDVQALGLEGGEAIGDAEELLAHVAQMVEPLLQTEVAPDCSSRSRCAGRWRISRIV